MNQAIGIRLPKEVLKKIEKISKEEMEVPLIVIKS